MFARGSATEILSRDQDRSLRVAWLMQHEIGDLLAVSGKTPVVEQELAESRALNALQKLLGDDLVCVHVHFIERDNDAGVLAKRLHKFLSTSCGSGAMPRLDGAKPRHQTVLLKSPIPNVGEMPSDGRCRRHHRTDQVRASSAALPPFEVSVAGRGAALSRLQDVGIHAETHGASRLAPFESGVQ